MKHRSLVMAVTGLTLALSSGIAMAEDAAPSPLPPMVLTEKTVSMAGFGGSFAGVVAPRISASLGFSTMGRLLSTNVAVGDSVRQGDVLATIEANALTLSAESARADWRAAQVQLENISATHARQLELLDRGIAPQSALDMSAAALETASARVEALRAAVAQAEDQLANATLIAPFDGVVVAVVGEVGQIVAPGSSVVTLARPDLRDAVIDLPERMIADVPADTEFTLRLEVAPEVVAVGRVRDIAPSADPATRLFRVRIGLDSAEPSFRFGTTVSAELATGRSSTAVNIPASAILDIDGSTSVWVVGDNDTVAPRVVTLLDEADGRAIVTGGLAAGEIVVTAGASLLTEGQSVRIYGNQR